MQTMSLSMFLKISLFVLIIKWTSKSLIATVSKCKFHQKIRQNVKYQQLHSWYYYKINFHQQHVYFNMIVMFQIENMLMSFPRIYVYHIQRYRGQFNLYKNKVNIQSRYRILNYNLIIHVLKWLQFPWIIFNY